MVDVQCLGVLFEDFQTTWKWYIVKHNCITLVYLIANWTTTCFGPYWPSSGCLKRTSLGSYYMYMHCMCTWCDTVVFDYIP